MPLTDYHRTINGAKNSPVDRRLNGVSAFWTKE